MVLTVVAVMAGGKLADPGDALRVELTAHRLGVEDKGREQSG